MLSEDNVSDYIRWSSSESDTLSPHDKSVKTLPRVKQNTQMTNLNRHMYMHSSLSCTILAENLLPCIPIGLNKMTTMSLTILGI